MFEPAQRTGPRDMPAGLVGHGARVELSYVRREIGGPAVYQNVFHTRGCRRVCPAGRRAWQGKGASRHDRHDCRVVVAPNASDSRLHSQLADAVFARHTTSRIARHGECRSDKTAAGTAVARPTAPHNSVRLVLTPCGTSAAGSRRWCRADTWPTTPNWRGWGTSLPAAFHHTSETS